MLLLLHECPGSLIGTRAHAVEPQRNAGMVEFVPKLSGTSPNPLIYLTGRQTIYDVKVVGKRSICINRYNNGMKLLDVPIVAIKASEYSK